MTNEKNDLPVNLSGAYVLNALDKGEAEAFEAHIAASPETRYEVTELRDTAVVLGLAVDPIEPPADLKASLMAKIAQTPQWAPAAPAAPVIESTPAIPSIADATPASTTEPELVGAPTAASFHTPSASESAAERKASSRWFTRPATLLASMAAAVALIAGGIVVTGNVQQAQFAASQADQLAAILGADDSQTAKADVTGGGKVTLTWSNELASSVVVANGVATLPADKVYELWYINEDGARPAGTFTAEQDDDGTWRVLDGEMQAGDTIGVTVEPAGGSETPTTDPVVAVTTA